MVILVPGKPLLAQLDILNTAGTARVAPGSGPVITMRRNNAVETGLALTVTNPATGQYLYYAAAVPAWSHGDQVILEADTGSTGVGAFAHFTVLDPAIPLASENATAVAAAMLVNPASKLLTNSSGHVTSTNGGGGGSSPSYIMPLRATAGQRVVPGRVTLFIQERVPTVLPIVDERGRPVDCEGKVCDLLVEVAGEVLAIDGLEPTGDPPHRYTFTPLEEMTAGDGEYGFSLRTSETNGDEVVTWGTLQVLKAVARA